MAITNNCASGRGMSRTKNQSKHIHYNSPGDRIYGQTARIDLFQKPNTPNTGISYFGVCIASISDIRVPTQSIDSKHLVME